MYHYDPESIYYNLAAIIIAMVIGLGVSLYYAWLPTLEIAGALVAYIGASAILAHYLKKVM